MLIKCNGKCNQLHFCEFELRNGGCQRGKPCKNRHLLATKHNINVLRLKNYQNFNFRLLEEVLKVSFYS
jgi:hypothetical protein